MLQTFWLIKYCTYKKTKTRKFFYFLSSIYTSYPDTATSVSSGITNIFIFISSSCFSCLVCTYVPYSKCMKSFSVATIISSNLNTGISQLIQDNIGKRRKYRGNSIQCMSSTQKQIHHVGIKRQTSPLSLFMSSLIFRHCCCCARLYSKIR